MRNLYAIPLLAVMAAPAHAEAPVRYDPAPLQRCISAAGGDARALRECEGDGASPCISAEGDATMAMTLCWDGEAQTWQAVMDATETRLQAAQPLRTDALAAARDAWESWSDAECSYRASAYGGGSGAQVELTHCAATLTAERAIRLIEAEHD